MALLDELFDQNTDGTLVDEFGSTVVDPSLSDPVFTIGTGDEFGSTALFPSDIIAPDTQVFPSVSDVLRGIQAGDVPEQTVTSVSDVLRDRAAGIAPLDSVGSLPEGTATRNDAGLGMANIIAGIGGSISRALQFATGGTIVSGNVRTLPSLQSAGARPPSLWQQLFGPASTLGSTATTRQQISGAVSSMILVGAIAGLAFLFLGRR